VDGKRRISAMSGDGSNVRVVTSGPAEHFHPAFSRDGSRIGLTAVESGASRITVMDSGGRNAKPVTPAGQRSRWPAWSPDGKRIAYYVQAAVSGIWQVEVDTLERSKLFDGAIGPTTLDWRADGREILFTRGAGMTAFRYGDDITVVDSGLLGVDLVMPNPTFLKTTFDWRRPWARATCIWRFQ
jgi:Tol biopolymer transport system component